MDKQKRVEERVREYLMQFERELKGLPADALTDSRNELESHIRDRVEAEPQITPDGVGAILSDLGDPGEIARLYRTETILASARQSFSPWVVVAATYRWALLSGRGLLSLMVAITGYGLSAALALSALLKPVFPERVGLWVDGPSVFIGFPGTASADARELLGWWIIPVGITVGALLLVVTTRVLRWMMKSSVRSTRIHSTAGGAEAI